MSDNIENHDADETDQITDRITQASQEYAEAKESVESIGRDNLHQLENVHDSLLSIFSKYEDKAVGTENFGAFLQCRAEVDALVEHQSPDLPGQATLERIQQRFDKRRLHHSDFKWARSELDEIREYLARLESESDAEDRFQRYVRIGWQRLDELHEEIERLEEIKQLQSLDFDVEIDHLRASVERYNEAISNDFDQFIKSTNARDVGNFLEIAQQYPLIQSHSFPDDVMDYLQETDGGERTIPELLEFAEYSSSKLGHYVDNPNKLKRIIATQRTAISRINSTPFQISWPPPPANEIRWRLRELIPLIDRFAEDITVEYLRTIRSMSESPRYETMQTVATARESLSEDELSLVVRSEVVTEISELTNNQAELEQLLNEVPGD